MAKLQDKFFNRVIEGDVEFQENEQKQVQSLMEKGEPMSGYSAVLGSVEGLTIEGVFSGAVKNGNKLTLVCAVNLTRTAQINSNLSLCDFTVPSAVFNKLYSTVIGAYGYLDNKVVNAWSSDSTYKELVSYILKLSNKIQFKIDAVFLNELTANTKYYYRYEVTFLLSDNLISNA